MSNWFREHPAYTIVGFAIAIATATWLVSSFVIDENKIDLYRAKSENAEAMSDQYKAKISILELELEKLRVENQRYYSWLSQEPRSIPALETKIKSLEEQLVSLSGNAQSSSAASGALSPTKNYQPYEFVSPFRKGESFVDPKTKATIGVSAIGPDFTATGILYLPDGESVEINKARPGETWIFKQDNTEYKLTLESVNWLNDSLKASVVEIKTDIGE